jgi:ferredoxin-NADP reductase
MRIHLKERRQETADVMSFIFDLNGQPFTYRPGQYLSYVLDALAFPDERGPRRHFTLSSSPTEKGIIQFTTRIRGSGFKETLRHAPLGYELTAGLAAGHFVLPEKEPRRHLFIAGGIGVTPYRSILRHAIDAQEPIGGVLLYFNRSSAEIIFRQELEQISRQMPGFTLVNVLSQPDNGWTGQSGKLDENLLRSFVPDPKAFLCWISGPPAMVEAYKDQIRQFGFTDEAVRTDIFIGY